MPTLTQIVSAATRGDLPYAFTTPASVPGCLAWYSLLDPLGFAATGSALISLLDRTGNGQSLTVSPAGNNLLLVAGPATGLSAVKAQPAGSASIIHGVAGSSLVRDRSLPFTASYILTVDPTGFQGVDNPTIGGVGFDTQQANGGFGLRLGHDGVSPYSYWLYVDLQSSSQLNNRIRVQTTKLTYGKTVHIVVTYDGSGTAAGVAVYFNGVAVALTVVNDTLGGDSIVGSSSTAYLGSFSTYSPSYNAIGDVAYYAAVLTAPQIAILYGYAQSVWAAGN